MSLLADAIASSGGSTTAKFPNVGDSWEGKIVGTDVRQQRDIETGELKTWKDGNPMNQALITIQTDERDPEVDDDDGTRTIYVKMWGQPWQALKQAIREAGDTDLQVGGFFRATHTSLGEKTNKAYNAPKLYEFEYKKPAGKVGKAAAEEPVSEDDDEPTLEEQIKGFIEMGWSDSKIRKALPGAKASVIAAIRDDEEE